VFSALLLAVSLSMAQGQGTNNISKYCSDRGDLGLSHGGCVAFLTANNIVPHDASVCKNKNIQNSVGAKNHGQCMKILRQLRR
jgi:hypothetical protein